MLKKRIIYKKVLIVMTVIAILYMIAIRVQSASLSVLGADDFSHGNGVGAFHVSLFEYVKASLAYAEKMYLKWQGTYFSMFIQALLSPINNFGFRQLRCVMAINALLFFCSLVVLVYSSLRKIDKEYNFLKIVIVAIIIFCFCGYDAYPEVFSWFSGATSYSFPLTFLLIAISMFLRIGDANKKRYMVGSILFGVTAMGGSLTVSGTGCFVALLVCIYLFLTNKRISIESVIVCLTWIAAAGINAMAPGNFLRHNNIDKSGVHPISALNDAIEMASIRWQFFFDSTNFVFLIFVIFIMGIYIGEKVEFENIKNRIIISAVALPTPIVTAFPVALGYSSKSLPNRCEFLIDAAIILSALNMAFSIGVVMLKMVDVSQKKMFKMIIIIIAATVFMLDGYGVSSIKIREISEQLRDGIYDEHYYACKDFINKLNEYDEGEDIRISINDFPENIDNVYNFYLSEDPSDWVNVAVAKYYGFNSIALYSE